MGNEKWYRVKVKDNRGRVMINWTAPLLLGGLTISTKDGKTVIVKRGLFGTQIYMPSLNESIETNGWLQEQIKRWRLGK